MNLRERTREYMKTRHLGRQEMAELLDIPRAYLSRYLDDIPQSGRTTVEAALQSYFLKLERTESRDSKPEFIPTLAANLILEKLQEADERKALGLLYGPPGIGKTFAIEEYLARVNQGQDPESSEVLLVTAHSASTPKSLMASLCLQAGIPRKGPASTLAESLVRKLEIGHYQIVIDEANHLDINAMELLRYVYDLGHLGVILIGTLRLYEIFTDGSRPAGELEQLWSRVGICELLPGLTEYEARQMIQRTLGRIPEATAKQILRQTGNSVRRLTMMLERLEELTDLNKDQEFTDLIAVASQSALGLARK